jgi:hypothetical protein
MRSGGGGGGGGGPCTVMMFLVEGYLFRLGCCHDVGIFLKTSMSAFIFVNAFFVELTFWNSTSLSA